MKKQNITLLELFRKCVSYYRNPTFPHEKKHPDTIRAYEIRYKNLLNFLQETQRVNLLAEDFSIKISKELYTYMRKFSCNNYAIRVCEMCNFVLKWGVNEEIIKVNQVFMFSLKKEPGSAPKYLTPDQVNKIESFVTNDLYLSRVKDLFLFQCYTGLSYNDLMRVSRNDVYYNHTDKRYYILIKRGKTKVQAIIPYTNKINEIWVKYGFQLPVISLQNYNRILKQLQSLTEIEETLKTHLARKTFAMIKLNHEGYSIEVVSRMIGHAKITTTETYYAFVNMSRISGEIAKIGA